jgi:hypothetical protein
MVMSHSDVDQLQRHIATCIKGFVTLRHFSTSYLDYDVPQWLCQIATFVLANFMSNCYFP